jgi:hypothetical protein
LRFGVDELVNGTRPLCDDGPSLTHGERPHNQPVWIILYQEAAVTIRIYGQYEIEFIASSNVHGQ